VAGKPDQIAHLDALGRHLGVALELGEAHQEGRPRKLRARLAQKLDGRQRGAAGRDEVIYRWRRALAF